MSDKYQNPALHNDFSFKSTCSRYTFLTVHFPIQVDIWIHNQTEGFQSTFFSQFVKNKTLKDPLLLMLIRLSIEDSHQKYKNLLSAFWLFCCTMHNLLWNKKSGMKSLHTVPETLHSIAAFVQNSPNYWPVYAILVYSTKNPNNILTTEKSLSWCAAIYHMQQIMQEYWITEDLTDFKLLWGTSIILIPLHYNINRYVILSLIFSNRSCIHKIQCLWHILNWQN